MCRDNSRRRKRDGYMSNNRYRTRQWHRQRVGRGGPFDHRDQLDDGGNGGPGKQNHDIGDEVQLDDERQVSLVVIPLSLSWSPQV